MCIRDRENMNRLDGKMETLKEELSQKIVENNETISKKVEEEITVIEQRITRALSLIHICIMHSSYFIIGILSPVLTSIS